METNAPIVNRYVIVTNCDATTKVLVWLAFVCDVVIEWIRTLLRRTIWALRFYAYVAMLSASHSSRRMRLVIVTSRSTVTSCLRAFHHRRRLTERFVHLGSEDWVGWYALGCFGLLSKLCLEKNSLLFLFGLFWQQHCRMEFIAARHSGRCF